MSYKEAENKTRLLREIYTPCFFYLDDTDDKSAFYELVKSEHIFVHDEIIDQLKELLKSRNPSPSICNKRWLHG